MSSETHLGGSVSRFLSTFLRPTFSLSARQKWVIGLFHLTSVVVFWVLSSFLVSRLVEDGTYRKPFLITYINTACFSLYLVGYLINERLSVRSFVYRMKMEYYGAQMVPNTDGETSRRESPYGSNNRSQEDLGEGSDGSLSDGNPNIGILETFKLSFQFIVLWFSANLVTNESLSYTSVASQTILSSTSSFFTLLIGYLYSVERFNRNKVLGLLLSFTGVTIVTKIDSSTSYPNRSNVAVLCGNALALSGALIYGIYTILLKFKTTNHNTNKERNLNTHLFFGFVGIICLVSFWPVLVLLHFLDYERFELPKTSEVTALLLINAFVTFISDFCWCEAVILTSPLTVTVGLSMTIPLAMIGDWLIEGFVINKMYLLGAIIVTGGFLIINRDEHDDYVPRTD